MPDLSSHSTVTSTDLKNQTLFLRVGHALDQCLAKPNNEAVLRSAIVLLHRLRNSFVAENLPDYVEFANDMVSFALSLQGKTTKQRVRGVEVLINRVESISSLGIETSELQDERPLEDLREESELHEGDINAAQELDYLLSHQLSTKAAFRNALGNTVNSLQAAGHNIQAFAQSQSLTQGKDMLCERDTGQLHTFQKELGNYVSLFDGKYQELTASLKLLIEAVDKQRKINDEVDHCLSKIEYYSVSNLTGIYKQHLDRLCRDYELEVSIKVCSNNALICAESIDQWEAVIESIISYFVRFHFVPVSGLPSAQGIVNEILVSINDTPHSFNVRVQDGAPIKGTPPEAVVDEESNNAQHEISEQVVKQGAALDVISVFDVGLAFEIQKLHLKNDDKNVLVVKVGEDDYAVPLSYIEGVIKKSPEEVNQLLAQTPAVLDYEGVEYVFRHLKTLLNGEGAVKTVTEAPFCDKKIILVNTYSRASEQAFALLVEGVKGTGELSETPQSIGGRVQVISGATLLGDNQVALLLELGALLTAPLLEEEQPANKRVTPLEVNKPEAQLDIDRMNVPSGESAADNSQLKIIIVVGASQRVYQLMSQFLSESDYELTYAESFAEAFECLCYMSPQLLVVFANNPKDNGDELVEFINNPIIQDSVPIISIVPSINEQGEELPGHSRKVSQWLSQPLSAREITASVKNVLEAAEC